jgi:hypothetical protein
MKKAREILMEVPVEAKVRNGLMKVARYLVAEKQLRPPGDYNQIRGLADEVLAICGYDSRYREFHGYCGNELASGGRATPSTGGLYCCHSA